MTNKDLCNFLILRTTAKSIKYGLKDPMLVVYNNGKNLYLGIKFKQYDSIFFIRFIYEKYYKAVFKLTAIDKSFKDFQAYVIDLMIKEKVRYILYDKLDIPQALKNKISTTFVQAFKTRSMGISIFNLMYGADISIVGPNETYEEIAIENDLNFAMNGMYTL